MECVCKSTFGLSFVGRFVLFRSVLYQSFHSRRVFLSVACWEGGHYLCIYLVPLLCSQIVVDAVLAVRKGPKEPIDLHMVEIMEMMHRSDTETRYAQRNKVHVCF